MALNDFFKAKWQLFLVCVCIIAFLIFIWAQGLLPTVFCRSCGKYSPEHSQLDNLWSSKGLKKHQEKKHSSRPIGYYTDDLESETTIFFLSFPFPCSFKRTDDRFLLFPNRWRSEHGELPRQFFACLLTVSWNQHRTAPLGARLGSLPCLRVPPPTAAVLSEPE